MPYNKRQDRWIYSSSEKASATRALRRAIETVRAGAAARGRFKRTGVLNLSTAASEWLATWGQKR